MMINYNKKNIIILMNCNSRCLSSSVQNKNNQTVSFKVYSPHKTQSSRKGSIVESIDINQMSTARKSKTQ